jgi:RNA polymerase sigma-70 factor (ECF subfamily)
VIANLHPNDDQYLPTRQSLLSRLKDKNDDASWREFFDRYWKLIYRAARQAGLTESQAQDVVQETVIAVWDQMPKFKYDPAKGTFKGFLYQTARFCILDQLRKRKQEARRHADLPPGTSGTNPIEKLVDPATLTPPNWDEAWDWNLVQVAIRGVKAKIKPKHFQIFDLYVLKQWPSKKVASTLGISIGQVFLAKFRITALLSKEIQKLKPQYDAGTAFSNGTKTFDPPGQ